MTFLTALILVVPIIIVFFIIVYFHTLVVYNLLIFFIDKFTFSKDPFLSKWKYKGKNVLKMSFAFFMFFHLLLFVDFYRTYINENTKYHDAKVYYVAGMIPQTYSVLLGRFVTPLNPLFLGITKPTNTMKEYLFEKGSRLIPDTDAEKELWEYEWFFYPYMIRMSAMYDSYHRSYGRWHDGVNISKETHNFMYKRLERLYEIITALNEKKIADLYRDADAMKKLPLMALYYKDKSQFLFRDYSMDSKSLKLFILEDLYGNREIQLINWLQLIPDKMDTQMQYQEWGNANLKALLKVEATRQQVVLDLMQGTLYDEIREYKFRCNSAITQAYVKLRNRYMMGGENSILDALARNGGEKDALAMYEYSISLLSGGEFFRVTLKEYCSINVLGKGKYVTAYKERSILDRDLSKILNKLKKEGKINE